MQIPIYITPSLAFELTKQGIEPLEYGPAYNGESVGLDLYYAGNKVLEIKESSLEVWDSEESFQPSEKKDKVLIPTGVHVALPKGYVGLILDRGSISKTDLIRRAGVIDPGYTDEIFVNLIGSQVIKPGEKLPVQLVVVPVEYDYTVVTKEKFFELTQSSQRKENKIGSSD